MSRDEFTSYLASIGVRRSVPLEVQGGIENAPSGELLEGVRPGADAAHAGGDDPGGEAEDRIANNPTPTLPGRFEDHGHIYETAAQDFVRYVSASLKCETRQPLRQGAARAIVIWWAMTG
jgi:hypothetical protein